MLVLRISRRTQLTYAPEKYRAATYVCCYRNLFFGTQLTFTDIADMCMYFAIKDKKSFFLLLIIIIMNLLVLYFFILGFLETLTNGHKDT